MPLVIVCGIPASGKTKRSLQLAHHLSSHFQSKVVHINEENLKISKAQAYSSAHEEKIMRGKLKFEVEKHLIGNTVVILDSLNYIKGFRYQMYCIARQQKTTYCVLFCNTLLEKALQFNRQREGNTFSPQMVEELAKRMEYPNLNDRWDTPLFDRRDDEETPFTLIANTLLFEAKKSKDPVSTKQEEKLTEDYLYSLDQICQQICEQICTGKLAMKNSWSALEAKKVKTAFTMAVREKPLALKIIKESFIHYITEADKRK